MHEGCNGNFQTGKETVDKVRMMGFSNQHMPMPLNVVCGGCNETFEMHTFEDKCFKCGMVHSVTSCHAFDPTNVKAAGIDY